MTEAPKTTTYRIFVRQQAGDTVGGVVLASILWEPLGTVEAVDQAAALDLALETAKSQTNADGASLAGDDEVELTVAAVSDRNWGEGTAAVELRSVTIWKKPTT